MARRKSAKQRARERAFQRRRDNPKKAFLERTRNRAKTNGVYCNLVIEDIPDIPEYCPVFPWVKLVYRVGHSRKGGQPPFDSPSVDRINNDLGYIPGNIRIISFMANQHKSNYSDKELIALGKDAESRVKIKELDNKQ